MAVRETLRMSARQGKLPLTGMKRRRGLPMKMVKHEVSAWTVGQLRKALAEFPDDMAVRVAPLEEPGGDLEAPLQVVINSEVRLFADDHGPLSHRAQNGDGKDYVALECDYPSGDYPPAE
jgi:Family of unknown function (DUF6225)